MPALAAPLIGFALGAGLYAWKGRALQRAVRPLQHQALVVVVLLGLGGWAPIVAYLASAGPAWALSYWFSPAAVPLWAALLWLLVTGAATPGGFAAARARAGRRPRAPLMLAGGALLAAAGALAAQWDRLVLHATFPQFHGDFGIVRLGDSPVGPLLLWGLVGVGAQALIAGQCLKHLARGGSEGA